MEPIIRIGIIDALRVTKSASLTFGSGGIQHRNNSKENLGSVVIGDSIAVQSVVMSKTADEDQLDNFSISKDWLTSSTKPKKVSNMGLQLTINIGGIKIISMTTAATVCIGQSAVANRNNSKSNSGPSIVGDGVVSMPMRTQVTYDPDQNDNVEIAGDNSVAVPQI